MRQLRVQRPLEFDSGVAAAVSTPASCPRAGPAHGLGVAANFGYPCRVDLSSTVDRKDYAHAYVLPRIGGERLQRLNDPQLLKFYAALLAEGRKKPDRNSVMYAFWSQQTSEGRVRRHVKSPLRLTRLSMQRVPPCGDSSPALFLNRPRGDWRQSRFAISTR